MEPSRKIRARDLAERTFWTAVAGGLAAVPAAAALDVATWKMALAAAAAAVVNAVLVIARHRLAFLPDPGAGLPGLPTEVS